MTNRNIRYWMIPRQVKIGFVTGMEDKKTLGPSRPLKPACDSWITNTDVPELHVFSCSQDH